MQIDYKNSNFFESDPARKKTRFLSSLLDLKLVLNGSRKEINEDDVLVFLYSRKESVSRIARSNRLSTSPRYSRTLQL